MEELTVQDALVPERIVRGIDAKSSASRATQRAPSGASPEHARAMNSSSIAFVEEAEDSDAFKRAKPPIPRRRRSSTS